MTTDWSVGGWWGGGIYQQQRFLLESPSGRDGAAGQRRGHAATVPDPGNRAATHVFLPVEANQHGALWGGREGEWFKVGAKREASPPRTHTRPLSWRHVEQEVHVSERGSAETALDKSERGKKIPSRFERTLTLTSDDLTWSRLRFNGAATAQALQLLSFSYFHLSNHVFLFVSSSGCM